MLPNPRGETRHVAFSENRFMQILRAFQTSTGSERAVLETFKNPAVGIGRISSTTGSQSGTLLLPHSVSQSVPHMMAIFPAVHQFSRRQRASSVGLLLHIAQFWCDLARVRHTFHRVHCLTRLQPPPVAIALLYVTHISMRSSSTAGTRVYLMITVYFVHVHGSVIVLDWRSASISCC